MSCSVNHEMLIRRHPMVTICPDCQGSVRNVGIIDLTDIPSSPPSASSTHSTAITSRAQSQRLTPSPGLVASGSGPSRTTFQQLNEAHHLAKAKRAESAISTRQPISTLVNEVTLVMYTAQACIEVAGPHQFVRYEQLKRCGSPGTRQISLTSEFDNHNHLIEHVKNHWRITGTYRDSTNCRFVGAVTLGHGANVTELAMDPEEPVRLGDIKRAMSDKGSKERFTLILFFPYVIETDLDIDDDELPLVETKKKRGRPASSRTEGKKRQSKSKVKVEGGSAVKIEGKAEIGSATKDVTPIKRESGDGEPSTTTNLVVRKGNKYGNLPPPLQTRRAAQKTTGQAGSDDGVSTDISISGENEFLPIEEIIEQQRQGRDLE
ncbi:hypothetical protein F4861DRAFT_537366 [Xylaria intraflava]|nr:hypothetical protein F4861DRAFT_537366 [Xylaria intraflava]